MFPATTGATSGPRVHPSLRRCGAAIRECLRRIKPAYPRRSGDLRGRPNAPRWAVHRHYKQVLGLSDRAKAELGPEELESAIREYGLAPVALSNDFVREQHNRDYKVVIPLERQPHTSAQQAKSGQCWAFAFNRVMENRKPNMGHDGAPLSESFLAYHAYRDRALCLLDLGANENRFPNCKYLDEGGSFATGMSVVRKHGIVPRSEMPAAADANASSVYFTKVRDLVAAGQREMRTVPDGTDAKSLRMSIASKYKNSVTQMLNTVLGEPPKRFEHNGRSYTPEEYARTFLGGVEPDYIELTHLPTRAWNRFYDDTWRPPVTERRYNVSMKHIQDAVKKTIDGGEPVWFATSLGSYNQNPYTVVRNMDDKFPHQADGLCSLAAFKYDLLINTAPVSKCLRIKNNITPTNHAMVITGYDPTPDGKHVRKWLVENSWGPNAGDNGHLHMYDDFFRYYTERVAVPRRHVEVKVLNRADRKRVLDGPLKRVLDGPLKRVLDGRAEDGLTPHRKKRKIVGH